MKTCRLCSHIMRDTLEKLFHEGKTIRYIEQYCKQNNLDLTYAMLQHHFKHHMARDSSSSPLIPIDLVNRLITNLEICNSKISNLLNSDEIDHNMLIRYISEIRHTVSELRSLLKEYNVKPNKSEDVFKLILTLMYDLPTEYIELFRKRYESYKQNPNLPVLSY